MSLYSLTMGVWSGLEDPTFDLCLLRSDGYWDVVNGVDGWVIYTPTERYVHDGKQWIGGPKSIPPMRGVVGVSRDEAQRFAEELIRKQTENESWNLQ